MQIVQKQLELLQLGWVGKYFVLLDTNVTPSVTAPIQNTSWLHLSRIRPEFSDLNCSILAAMLSEAITVLLE